MYHCPPSIPWPWRASRQRNQREQSVVEFLSVADVWPSVITDACDGGGVEAANLGQNCFGKNAAHFDSAGAALFERGVIEERVRIGVQDFVRKLRRHRS